MKRIAKNDKFGFTLVEMVLVIFIIIVLAAILLYGLVRLINMSETKSSHVSSHQNLVDDAQHEVDGLLPHGA